jgi:hypothetical protein
MFYIMHGKKYLSIRYDTYPLQHKQDAGFAGLIRYTTSYP